MNIPTDDITIAKIENNQQVVTDTVNEYGYSPAVIVLQKGIEAKIQFNTEKLNSCNDIVGFPEYRGQLDLKEEDQKETPWLVPDQDFTFQCWKGMLHGYVKVVEDSNAVNLDEIKVEVENYQPPQGGASCHLGLTISSRLTRCDRCNMMAFIYPTGVWYMMGI